MMAEFSAFLAILSLGVISLSSLLIVTFHNSVTILR